MLKRILAIAGVVILAGLYIASLVTAIIGSEYCLTLCTVSICATIVVPIIIYLFQVMMNVRKGKSIFDNVFSYKDDKS